MFNKLSKKWQQYQQLKKMKKFYKIIKQGAWFLEYILQDLDKQKKQQLNRAQRRRFEKTLKDGQISREMIEHYSKKIDQVFTYIKMQKKMNKKPFFLTNLFKQIFKKIKNLFQKNEK